MKNGGSFNGGVNVYQRVPGTHRFKKRRPLEARSRNSGSKKCLVRTPERLLGAGVSDTAVPKI